MLHLRTKSEGTRSTCFFSPFFFVSSFIENRQSNVTITKPPDMGYKVGLDMKESMSYRQFGGNRNLLVDFGPVCNVLRSVRIVQCRQSLLNIDGGGRNCGDDWGLSSTSQGILEQAGQLRFSREQKETN